MADITPTAGYDAIPLLEDTQFAQGRQLGDSVANGQEETANSQAYRLANNIEALKTGRLIGPRNSVLNGASTAGLPSFGTFSGQVLTITGAVTPMLFNFAQGYSDFGVKETFVKYTGTVTIDYTASVNTDDYLVFAVWSGTAISFVSLATANTGFKYLVQATAPTTTATDRFYFNTVENKMYREISSVWTEVMAIYVGGVYITGSGGDEFHMKPYGTPAFSLEEPVGCIKMWHDIATIPPGWIECDGPAVKIIKYPELSRVVASTYAALTATEFTLPDLSGNTINSATIKYIIKAY